MAAVLACLISAAAPAAPPTPSGELLYPTAARDTLIGVARRLLLEPQRWREVQQRNGIADPRHIPLGTILRIPYTWLKLTPESATVVSVGGEADAGGHKLAIGDLLPQGTVIRTGTAGSVTLDLADGSVVTLQKSSVLELDQMVQVAGLTTARSVVLKLDAGRVETAVRPHRDVGRFEIVTPVAVSAVRGTQFRDSFTAEEAHGTTETLEGAVGVGNERASVAVAAGFGTRIEPGREPLTPVLLLPAPDLTQLPAGNGGARLRLHWSPVAGAHQYRVQLSTGRDFHVLTADQLTDAAELDLPAPGDGTYWLRARSIDALGIEGPDAVRSLTQHLLPAAPQTLSPAVRAKLIDGSTHLAWSADATAASYAVQVATDESFAAPVVERRDLASPAVDLADLAPGEYFWRARALDGAGAAGPWSGISSFARRPLMEPPQFAVERRSVAFRWAEQPGATYRLQVARSSTFKHPFIDRHTDEPGSSMPKPFPGIYYVRVQNIDAEGSAGAFSAPRRFVVPIPLWVKMATPLAVGLAVLL